MSKKKYLNLFLALLIGLIFLFLAAFFILFFIFRGIILAGHDSLFRLLARVNYSDLYDTFEFVFISMVVFDLLTVVLKRLIQIKKNQVADLSKNFLNRFWRNNFRIHLTFILLTIFLTISIGLPATIMDSFTAIVSISVLISNLTKTKDKKD
ncbi:putative membrane protein [Weissella oryzae SG25]|uniref:Putative membrane protein n=1 Tax=Weissella oryzae (strain DSM 25784 / JCM 18191 / LMG 30913 / SG25) TaxID=1329250 RepID=A0A069CS71_WEIOS|nr:hypothetical protein [Weissella oryzae]GAK30242.1 putative membrane protein [Weissella oryzae SG25]